MTSWDSVALIAVTCLAVPYALFLAVVYLTNGDTSMSWTVTVHGDPVPQGSKNAPAAGRVVDVSGARLKAWRYDIGWNATAARNRAKVFVPADGPVALDVVFRVPAKGAAARPGFPAPVTPDTDKLLRAVLDALTGVAYGDDRQVTEIAACKRFPDEGEKTGVTIIVRSG